MTTDELEEKLEAGRETPNLDFKNRSKWDVKKLAKDILAMSNTQDGGLIIIGVKDQTFERIGITAEEKGTYNEDIMKDQMKKYADPHADFTVNFQKDRNGLEYAIIRVFEFQQIPVICASDSKDTTEGVIYYRNRNKKVESAQISNAYDMRDLIELAAIKMMRRMEKIGFKAKTTKSVKEKLDKELNGL